MPFTKLDRLTKLIADLPDSPNDSMTSTELKKYWDSSPEELRKTLNQLIDDLHSDKAAGSIGISAIPGVTGKNVQEILAFLQTDLSGHKGDTDIHVTLAEKTRWDAAAGVGEGVPVGAATKAELKLVDDKIGNLANLKTTDKTNIVSSLNEVLAKAGSGGEPPKIYGVRIDKTNSNPLTAVTYINDAVGMSPAPAGGGASGWDNVFPFNQIRPVLFKDGKVVAELSRNDFSKDVGGSPVDITSGVAGDVMIEFPKVFWKITSNTDEIIVQFSEKRIDERWKALAHTRGDVEKEKIYVGAYLASESAGKYRSLSGKTPVINRPFDTHRSSCKANGVGYEMTTFYQILLLQILYLTKYKSLDSQTALGKGYAASTNTTSTQTGGANNKGLDYGEISGTQQMKFCGVEDFWGNYYWVFDGAVTDTNWNLLIGTDSYNSTGSGYNNFGQTSAANIKGYVKDIRGTTETGFIAKNTEGSASTWFCDYGAVHANCVPRFGSHFSSDQYNGAFNMVIDMDKGSSATPILGARISFV